MTARHRTALVLLAVALAPGPTSASERRTWKVERAGVTFELTRSDFRAWTGDPSGPPALSIAALLADGKKKFDEHARELAKGLTGPDAPTYGEHTMYENVTFDVLSVVGTLVIIRETGDSYTPGTAHPTRYDVLHVRDFQRKDAKPSLLDFYTEKQLVQALKVDPWIRKFADPEGGFAEAATLKDLVASLDLEWAQQNAEHGDCAFDVSFSSGMVGNFFFHHVRGDEVAVRIAVPPGSEWCNRAEGGQQIGLLLPIPERIRDDLLEAVRGEAGFLAANRKTAGSPTFSATWELDIRTLVPRR